MKNSVNLAWRTLIPLLAAACAAAQNNPSPFAGLSGQSVARTEATLRSGVRIQCQTMLTQPAEAGPGLAQGYEDFGGGFQPEGESLRRLLYRRADGAYIGYELTVAAAPQGYSVTIQPLRRVDDLIQRFAPGTSLAPMPPPTYPPPNVIREGDMLALDLLTSSDGRQKLTDYIRISRAGAGAAALMSVAGRPLVMTRTCTPLQYAYPGYANAPYSGEQAGETIQTLADGTKITRSQAPIRYFRDSEGRARTESPLFSGPPPEREILYTVEIYDPVAGVQYFLDTQNKIAHRYTLRPPPEAPGAQSARPAAGRSTPGPGAPRPRAATTTVMAGGVEKKTEHLGTRVIEGIEVEGTRETSTEPAGHAGNSIPLVTVTETWRSAELGMMLLRTTSDPRTGEKTEKLVSLNRSQQDVSLFQPPPDYRVVDEAAPVTITYTHFSTPATRPAPR